MSGRLLHRVYLEAVARVVLAAAEVRGATARETRRMLRARFKTLDVNVSRSAWYAAAVRAAGCRLFELPDFRQPTLLDRGPRRRRSRRKKTAHAAA